MPPAAPPRKRCHVTFAAQQPYDVGAAEVVMEVAAAAAPHALASLPTPGPSSSKASQLMSEGFAWLRMAAQASLATLTPCATQGACALAFKTFQRVRNEP